MSADGGGELELESAIARVYGGPLEDFVRRRDALAKELRAAGRRDDAAAVKALRKPSRIAWALDAAAVNGSGAMDSLDAAVQATVAAHADGGDVRTAMVELRAAVRDFAGRAAALAQAAGHRLDQPTLANAVLAVLGKPDALADLRRGTLTDVPDAGGLDFLTSLPTPAGPPPKPPAAPPRAAPAASAAPSTKRDEEEAAAREAVAQTEQALAAARERTEAAKRSLTDVAASLEEAEERLRQAEEEARVLRMERNRLRAEVETATARLQEAQNALVQAKRRLERVTGKGGHG